MLLTHLLLFLVFLIFYSNPIFSTKYVGYFARIWIVAFKNKRSKEVAIIIKKKISFLKRLSPELPMDVNYDCTSFPLSHPYHVCTSANNPGFLFFPQSRVCPSDFSLSLRGYALNENFFFVRDECSILFRASLLYQRL